MSAAFSWLSRELKRSPLRTNIALTTVIGFCGDVICQTIYEPLNGIRRITPNSLPSESFSSPLLFRVKSPALMWRAARRRKEDKRKEAPSALAVEPSPYVFLDIRRSLIFCSFSCLFSVPYFLWVYRQLDRLYPPPQVTKMQAIYKGFLSYIAANLTTPLYMAHITALDRLIIYRDARDGRRRVHRGPAEEGKAPTPTYICSDKAFNWQEFSLCFQHDWMKRIRNDFPDVLRYGIFFWGVNWLPMFYYIPPHFRLLYSACLQVAWSGIMSFMLHRGEH